MNPQAVTVGARLGRKINIVLASAAQPDDRVGFFGGLLASIAGGIAGIIGPHSAAELLRITLAKLEGRTQLQLAPGVRLAIATAELQDPAPEAANAADRFSVTDICKAFDVPPHLISPVDPALLMRREPAAPEQRRVHGVAKARLLELIQALPEDCLIRAAVGRDEPALEILSVYSGAPGEAWIDVGREQSEADFAIATGEPGEAWTDIAITTAELRLLASGWIMEIPGVHRTDSELREAARAYYDRPSPEDDTPVTDILRRIFGLAAVKQ